MYHAQWHRLIRLSSTTISKYNICDLSCKVYIKAQSPENLQSGFMRTGVFPLDRNAVPKTSTIPSKVFESEVIDCSQGGESSVEGGVVVYDMLDMFELKERLLKSIKSEGNQKKTRNTISKHISGKELTSIEVMKAVEQHVNSQYKTSKKSKLPRNYKVKINVKYQQVQVQFRVHHI